jgi:hypothetical protein
MSRTARRALQQSRYLTNGTRILNPVASAMYAAQWKAEAVSGRIHALIGEDGLALVNGAGRVFFVVLRAAAQAGIDAEHPDMRVLRGAIEALHEQAEDPKVQEVRRAGIVSGLHACDRILPHLTTRGIADAALFMEARLRQGDVRYSDFQGLIPAKEATS